MTTLAPFTFPATGQQVRTVTNADEHLFVGKDAATVLGHSNPRKAVRDHVPAAHRRGNESFLPSDLGLDPQTVLITEPGLYRLILRSNTEMAERFQEWVTEDVLPALRKTGSYTVAPQPMDELELAERNVALIKEKRALAAEVQELRPAADSWNTLAAAEGDLSVADAAKILSRDPAISLGRDRLFDYMGSDGWAFRQRSDHRWRASQDQVNRGRLAELPQTYEDERTGQRVTGAPQVRVTCKGLHELHRRLGGIRQLQITEGGDG